mmetsp:Transcript_300/g.676  ORF Transcript_300/g.676 Transcript_300/m.676 type:complete len:344 (-) Transcript_300:765-1796(-)
MMGTDSLKKATQSQATTSYMKVFFFVLPSVQFNPIKSKAAVPITRLKVGEEVLVALQRGIAVGQLAEVGREVGADDVARAVQDAHGEGHHGNAAWGQPEEGRELWGELQGGAEDGGNDGGVAHDDGALGPIHGGLLHDVQPRLARALVQDVQRLCVLWRRLAPQRRRALPLPLPEVDVRQPLLELDLHLLVLLVLGQLVARLHGPLGRAAEDLVHLKVLQKGVDALHLLLPLLVQILVVQGAQDGGVVRAVRRRVPDEHELLARGLLPRLGPGGGHGRLVHSVDDDFGAPLGGGVWEEVDGGEGAVGLDEAAEVVRRQARRRADHRLVDRVVSHHQRVGRVAP